MPDSFFNGLLNWMFCGGSKPLVRDPFLRGALSTVALLAVAFVVVVVMLGR